MRNLPSLSIFLPLAFAAIGFQSTGLADDWPQWRGPSRDAVWREGGIVDRLPEGKLPRKWTAKVASGYSGPTVADGRVFVTDRVSKEMQTGDGDSERVLCFDASNGKPLWTYTYDAPYTISYRAGPRSPVTIDGDLAYAVGAMGHFHCLNVVDGSVVWKRDLNSEYKIAMPIWGISAAPLIYKNLVIQQVGGTGGACMVAFDKASGKEVWRALNDCAGYSTPTVITQAGQDVLVCWTGDSVSGLNPMSGKVHWAFPFPPSKMPIGIATPVVSGDRLFVTSFYDGSVMLRVPADRIEYELLWRRVGRSEQDTDALQSIISNPIFVGDLIYGVDSYGEFRCLDAKTGDRLWEDQSLVRRNRWATIHMVQRDDKVWMFNEQGELMITELSETGAKILSRAQLIAPTRIQLSRRDEGVCWAPPAFANRCIFVRSDNELVCCSLAVD
jgi:outer membrane protein assembly factor BamB